MKPAAKYASATSTSWRVQRSEKSGIGGGFEMAFVHEDKALCEAVAKLLNDYENH